MLHYLFDFLYNNGFYATFHNLFNYLSFRSALAIIISIFVTIYFGKIVIHFLNKKLVQDQIRDLGLEGQTDKQGTPTMGGVIIIIGILVPTLLLCRLNNIYILILILSTLWMGLIGFIDDYIKVFKRNKKGLAARFKIIGQFLLGLIVSYLMFFHQDIVIQDNVGNPTQNMTLVTDFSNDIFINESSFAQYTFNHGFGLVSDNQSLIFDYETNNIQYSNKRSSLKNELLFNIGRAYLQKAYQDFIDKK